MSGQTSLDELMSEIPEVTGEVPGRMTGAASTASFFVAGLIAAIVFLFFGVAPKGLLIGGLMLALVLVGAGGGLRHMSEDAARDHVTAFERRMAGFGLDVNANRALVADAHQGPVNVTAHGIFDRERHRVQVLIGPDGQVRVMDPDGRGFGAEA